MEIIEGKLYFIFQFLQEKGRVGERGSFEKIKI